MNKLLIEFAKRCADRVPIGNHIKFNIEMQPMWAVKNSVWEIGNSAWRKSISGDERHDSVSLHTHWMASRMAEFRELEWQRDKLMEMLSGRSD